MKYDVSKWLSNVSAVQHQLASEARLVLADARDNELITEAEVATVRQWIADAERLRDEAYALLTRWTTLPRSTEAASERNERSAP